MQNPDLRSGVQQSSLNPPSTQILKWSKSYQLKAFFICGFKRLLEMAQGTQLSGAGSVHPGRMTVGQHLPYTGREVETFSRLGYFYPPGYLPNTPRGFLPGLAKSLTNPGYGMKANSLKAFGMGAAKFIGCFLLFYLPLDGVYCDLRKKQRERRAKLRGN